MTATQKTMIDPARLRLFALWAGPLASAVLWLFADLEPGRPEVTRMAAVALLMAVWWTTEAIPLAATAMLPLILFPALGLMDGKTTSSIYVNHIIFLFIGGFMVALAMQKWDLHKRIALVILARLGADTGSILLGFMAATAVLSMWISNTATAMMMMPISMAIVLNLKDVMPEEDLGRYAKGIFLGIAYGASIGGTATLIGTPPNLILTQTLAIQFPAAPELSFARWLMFGLPLASLCLVLTWLYLKRRYRPGHGHTHFENKIFQKQLEALGPFGFEEKWILSVFLAMAALWMTRADLTLGFAELPGWSRLFENPGFFNDGTVSMAMALLLFLIPSKNAKGQAVLDWETAAKLPWGIVLLFGGGFALAEGFKVSGLAQWFTTLPAGLEQVHPLFIMLVVCLLITFLTELTSNTATAQMFLPVLAALAVGLSVHPLLMMIPATLSCSFAFMLPVATPPNAIVFGSGMLKIQDMARTGLVLNLVGALLVALYTYLLGSTLLGIDLTVPPDWLAAP